jgi:5'-nucleotidase
MMILTTTRVLLAALVLITAGCAGTRPSEESDVQELPAPPSRIAELVLIQLNDVYEITPVEGGKRGGLARVATLQKELLAENPNTYSVMAGDFLSPSALGTAKVDGERLAGKQMVAVLNQMGLDFVTYGNHEFDLDREQFLSRVEESSFAYISGNVFDENGNPFPRAEPYRIIPVPSPAGDTLRVALLGVTGALNMKDYVSYSDHTEVLKQQVEQLRDEADAFVAMTHLFLAQDVALSQEIPELDLIIGGHDHENVQVWRGPGLTPIVKADANARTVYVLRLRYDFEMERLETDVELRLITDEIPDDPATAAVVEEWLDRAWDGFRQSGFQPEQQVVTIDEPLDGRESAVRNHPTALTKLIAAGMRSAAGDVDLAMFNSGSIRIDDFLPPGPVTQYDVIRVMPFGGTILTVEMTGGLLDSVLTQSVANKGTGGYLQIDGATQDGVMWRVGDDFLLPRQTYRVAVNDFLVSGREANLGYLTLDDPRIRQVAEHGDIRMAAIAELKRRYQQ